MTDNVFTFPISYQERQPDECLKQFRGLPTLYPSFHISYVPKMMEIFEEYQKKRPKILQKWYYNTCKTRLREIFKNSLIEAEVIDLLWIQRKYEEDKFIKNHDKMCDECYEYLDGRHRFRSDCPTYYHGKLLNPSKSPSV